MYPRGIVFKAVAFGFSAILGLVLGFGIGFGIVKVLGIEHLIVPAAVLTSGGAIAGAIGAVWFVRWLTREKP